MSVAKGAALREREDHKRQIQADAERAIATLLRRSQWAGQRAMRAPKASNERRKLGAQAGHLHALALSLSRNEGYQESLHERRLLTRDWRVLAEAIIDLHRKAAA